MEEKGMFAKRLEDYKKNPKKYSQIKKSICYALISFVVLTALELLAYFGLFNANQNLNKYAIWLFYLNLSISFLVAAIWYMKSYKSNLSCMTGMMVGMTIGMQTGMMIGAILGATNGFFIGAMAGMLLGIVAGAILGSGCGIMGIMEGMMAGVMGGTMGPMITVMMLNDHLQIFMPFYIIANLLIVIGLIYMYFEEVVEPKKDIQTTDADFLTFVSACIIIAVLLIAIILWGPKSALLAVFN